MQESWFKKLCKDIVKICGEAEIVSQSNYEEMFWKKIHFYRPDVFDKECSFFFDMQYYAEMDVLVFRSYSLNYKNEQLQMTEGYQTIYQFMQYGSFQPMIWRFVRECVRRII